MSYFEAADARRGLVEKVQGILEGHRSQVQQLDVGRYTLGVLGGRLYSRGKQVVPKHDVDIVSYEVPTGERLAVVRFSGAAASRLVLSLTGDVDEQVAFDPTAFAGAADASLTATLGVAVFNSDYTDMAVHRVSQEPQAYGDFSV